MPTFIVVNMIPQSLSGEHNQDSEPNLAVNPANPLQIAASAFTPNPAGSGNAPIFLSLDGGNTWALQTIVPSDTQTADITLRFSGNGVLYAGILRMPILTDPDGNPTPTLNILSTNDVTNGQDMALLVNRTGAGVDQPYIQTITVASNDVLFCGDNDFNHAPQSATIDFSPSASANPSNFQSVAIDVRGDAAGDAPSIRPAIHPDGTVFGAFLRRTDGTSPATFVYDVVVVRDDSFGQNAPVFSALVDPSDGVAGRIVAQTG